MFEWVILSLIFLTKNKINEERNLSCLKLTTNSLKIVILIPYNLFGNQREENIEKKWKESRF